MAYREALRLEIAEVIRRWQTGNSQSNIASGTGLSRDTVRKYLAAAKGAGVVQEGPGPHRGPTQPAGRHQPLRPSAVRGLQRGTAGSLGALAYLGHWLNGTIANRYRSCVVDGAREISPTEFGLLYLGSANNGFTVLGDTTCPGGYSTPC